MSHQSFGDERLQFLWGGFNPRFMSTQVHSADRVDERVGLSEIRGVPLTNSVIVSLLELLDDRVEILGERGELANDIKRGELAVSHRLAPGHS